MPAQKKQIKKSAKGKVVAIDDNENAIDKKQTLLKQAATAEKKDELKLAEALLKKEMNQKTFNAAVYKKLMVLYRKQKRYKDELEIINKGLKHFEEYRTKQSSQKNVSASIKRISKSLSKSLGLTNNRGKEIFEPVPVPEWKKRKENVEKKLKA